MFQLMAPCGLSTPYGLHGPLGATPDVSLLRLNEKCRRFTLPPFIDQLVFHFTAVPHAGVCVQNFYHLGDFFVVSDSCRRFLESQAGCAFEVSPIRTSHPEGRVIEPYWAMKVVTRVDCIVADQSFAKRPSWSSDPAQPFTDLAMVIDLAADVAPGFANRGPHTYVAYPGTGVKSVTMEFGCVPQGVRLFEPLYWPHFLVIDSAFARELESQCQGGGWGYYFWTLGFDEVSNTINSLMHMLR